MNYTLAIRNMQRQMNFLVTENLSIINAGRDRFNQPTLEMLWEVVRKECPFANLGLFHDSVRNLTEEGIITLIPFTRAFATLGTRSNAIYLDGEVMVYVVPGSISENVVESAVKH